MNDAEKQRILDLVVSGALNAEEAAGIIVALSDPPTPRPVVQEASKAKEASITGPVQAATPGTGNSKDAMMEVQMQRGDGSTYAIQVPTNLFPLFWGIAKTAIKESARTAAQESWDGFKHIVRRKTQEATQAVKDRVSPPPPPPPVPVAALPPPPKVDNTAARVIVLQMLQQGNISAEDAAELLIKLEGLGNPA